MNKHILSFMLLAFTLNVFGSEPEASNTKRRRLSESGTFVSESQISSNNFHRLPDDVFRYNIAPLINASDSILPLTSLASYEQFAGEVLAISPNKQFFVIKEKNYLRGYGNWNKFKYTLYNIQTNTELFVEGVPTNDGYAKFSADSKFLLFLGDSGNYEIYIYNIEQNIIGNKVSLDKDTSFYSEDGHFSLSTKEDDQQRKSKIEFTPDNQKILVYDISSYGKDLRLYDIATGLKVFDLADEAPELNLDEIISFQITPDSRKLILKDNDGFLTYDLQTGQEEAEAQDEDISNAITFLKDATKYVRKYYDQHTIAVYAAYDNNHQFGKVLALYSGEDYLICPNSKLIAILNAVQ